MQTNSKLYQTDQIRCFDYRGQEINCPRTGQDGDIRAGNTWPIPRFDAGEAVVKDFLSGLMWTKDATPDRFPQTWKEAFGYVDQMNAAYSYGYDDWRLPDRYELFSLISHSQVNPALPANHPFTNVFAGYYWTSSPCCQWPNQAWYIHLGGGRVFKGMKQGSYLVWPVRNIKQYKPLVSISFLEGHRFDKRKDIAIDRSTGLMWSRSSAGSSGTVDWTSSLSFIKEMNENKACGFDDWRLPNVRELESLVALNQHSPAFSDPHPFYYVGEGYWSSTTSVYDPSYAWVLYTDDGNVGVGFKEKAEFCVLPVRS